MAYREKVGWLTLVAMVVTFGPYFTLVALHTIPAAALPNVRQLVLFAISAIAQAVILTGGHLYLRHVSPEEARLPPDERERGIIHRSLSSAYYVLIAGMIVVGCMMPFNSSGWTLVNTALFMIVVAEAVRCAVMVASYRRQA
ncbi:MAG TPA: hypothetical protein VG206_27785 [Terriglobia bacterium]|nr:hypothetical protein [Terriglobia bacterium]